MPDGYPNPAPEPVDDELERERAKFVEMLEEGLADIDAGRVVSLEDLDRMIDEAFAQQDADLARKR